MSRYSSEDSQDAGPSDPADHDSSKTSDDIGKASSIATQDDLDMKDVESPLSSRTSSPVPTVINVRAYQREMFQQSLQRNVIVVMDTGSGKTQVAILRIQAELERSPTEKIVWFLAPTVSLCAQQFNVIQGQIPSESSKLITGEVNVDSWLLSTWSRILSGTRIVVSTPQILLDALSHGFVRMEILALLVFDEVHNCLKNNPGCNIMKKFYDAEKKQGRHVPSIMGLTASPVISSKLDNITDLESTMDSVCITPTIHREELLRTVKKPRLLRRVFESYPYLPATPLMRALKAIFLAIDPTTDPQVLRMQKDKSEEGQQKLFQTIIRNDTFSQSQFTGLWSRSVTLQKELGDWAADKFIASTIQEFLARIDSPDDFFNCWSNEDRAFLASHLRKLPIPESVNEPPEASRISNKAAKLIQELSETSTDVVGIIFVKERATVSMMCELLNSVPSVNKHHRAGAVVGASTNASRKKNMYELLGTANTQALEEFRTGAINLLVATSVLEEGIDVPQCNLVICFDETSTLKAFIQRRGRARMQDSVMIAFENADSSHRVWEDMEMSMKKQYEDDQRELNKLDELAKSEPTDSIYYIVESSGARLDLDNAKQHLEHFCQVVFAKGTVNFRPEYIIQQEVLDGVQLKKAQVILPPSLPIHIRQFESSHAWKCEKNAIKDAAFQAYFKLYKEGMINKHLLPILETIEPEEEPLPLSERLPEPLLNPWVKFGPLWKTDEDKWSYKVKFLQDGKLRSEYAIILPVHIQRPRTVKIFVGSEKGTQWHIEFDQGQRISHQEAVQMPDHTSALLAFHFGHRRTIEDREHVIKVTSLGHDLTRDQIGAMPIEGHLEEAQCGQYLVRDHSKSPYMWASMIPKKPKMEDVNHPFYEFEEAPENEPYIVVDKWTRRSDWLHDLICVPKSSSQALYDRVLPSSRVTIDVVPRHCVEFGMLLPSIIHELEVQLIATDLSSTLLESVEISDLQLVVQAITSRSAREPVDYEWLEFIGDSILKLFAVIQVMAENLTWPESILSHLKDKIVSNSRLLRATKESGLSKYIISQSFTGQKWKPKYLDETIQQEPEEPSWRGLGEKSLADVIESLVGASFMDGGLTKATKCLSIFLGGNRRWHGEAGRNIMFDAAASDIQLPPTLDPLEQLIGYSFQKKTLLLEAVTHISFIGAQRQRSLERLEFLGDAVLDYIIVKRLAAVQPPLSVSRLHSTKSSMVHGDFLAFICMSHGTLREEVVPKSDGNLEEREEFLPLWKFMRHSIPTLPGKQAQLVERFESLRREIVHELEYGQGHPWGLLSRLKAPKYLSDMIESLIGAVWVDSGSLETCEILVQRLGIMPCLERLIRDDICSAHPAELLADCSRAIINYNFRQVKGLDEEFEYGCRVEVGDQIVAEVEGMSTRNEAMTQAAEKALKMFMDKNNTEMANGLSGHSV